MSNRLIIRYWIYLLKVSLRNERKNLHCVLTLCHFIIFLNHFVETKYTLKVDLKKKLFTITSNYLVRVFYFLTKYFNTLQDIITRKCRLQRYLFINLLLLTTNSMMDQFTAVSCGKPLGWCTEKDLLYYGKLKYLLFWVDTDIYIYMINVHLLNFNVKGWGKIVNLMVRNALQWGAGPAYKNSKVISYISNIKRRPKKSIIWPWWKSLNGNATRGSSYDVILRPMVIYLHTENQ